MSARIDLIAVIGGRFIEPAVEELAFQVGYQVLKAGFGVVCGGYGGVMEAACRGAHEAKTSGAASQRLPIVGILKDNHVQGANPYVEVAIPTGMGLTRNCLVALAGCGVIAVGGMSGTLSEMAMAWQFNRPVAGLCDSGGWTARLAGHAIDSTREDIVYGAQDAADAVAYIAAQVRGHDTMS